MSPRMYYIIVASSALRVGADKNNLVSLASRTTVEQSGTKKKRKVVKRNAGLRKTKSTVVHNASESLISHISPTQAEPSVAFALRRLTSVIKRTEPRSATAILSAQSVLVLIRPLHSFTNETSNF